MDDTDPSAVILDSTRTESERIEAMNTMVYSKREAAVMTLLTLGSRNGEPSAILKAVGERLAQLSQSGVRITEFDMRDLSETAYLAYCDWEPRSTA